MKTKGHGLGRHIRLIAAFAAALLSASVIQSWVAPASANTNGNGLVVRDLSFRGQPLLHHVDGTDNLVLTDGESVQIWTTTGVLTHTFTDIGGVRDIASSGDLVAMIAHNNGNSSAIVVVNAATGVETARILGNTDIDSTIAIDGDSIWWLERQAGTDPDDLDYPDSPFNVVNFSLSGPVATRSSQQAPGIGNSPGNLDAIPGDSASAIYEVDRSGFRVFASGAEPIEGDLGQTFSGFDNNNSSEFWAVGSGGRATRIDLSTMNEVPGSQSSEVVALSPFETDTDGSSWLLYNNNGPDFDLIPAATPNARQRLTLSAGRYRAQDVSPTQVFAVWSKLNASSPWTGSDYKLVVADRSLATPLPYTTTTTSTTTTTTTTAPTSTTTTSTTTTVATTTTTIRPTGNMVVRTYAHGVPPSPSFTTKIGCRNYGTTSLAYNSATNFIFDTGYYCHMRRSVPSSRGSYVLVTDDGTYVESTQFSHLAADGDDFTVYLHDFYPSAYTDIDLFINEQFEAALGRQPSSSEFNYWADQLIYRDAELEAIAATLLRTDEFGSKIRPVSRLYLAYFDRWSDRGGERYWVDLHRGGLHLNDISAYFESSEEFRLTYGNLSNRGFVSLIYRNVLKRAYDQEGLSYWTSLLDGGNFTRGQLMVQFSESAEYRSLTDGRISTRSITVGEVDLEPDERMLTSWDAVYRNENGNLTELVKALLDSQAYYNKFYWFASGGLVSESRLDRPSALPPVSGSASTEFDGTACRACPVIERQ